MDELRSWHAICDLHVSWLNPIITKTDSCVNLFFYNFINSISTKDYNNNLCSFIDKVICIQTISTIKILIIPNIFPGSNYSPLSLLGPMSRDNENDEEEGYIIRPPTTKIIIWSKQKEWYVSSLTSPNSFIDSMVKVFLEKIIIAYTCNSAEGRSSDVS